MYQDVQVKTSGWKARKSCLIKAMMCTICMTIIIILIVWATGNFNKHETGSLPLVLTNDETVSVYLGNGCFWHTQYDMYMVEKEPPFDRTLEKITSLTGYAGSVRTSPKGYVCYHSWMGVKDSDYGHLGHAEVVQVQLVNETTIARKQFAALLKQYFEHGFQSVSNGRLRLDPQDSGPEYRNQIGIPGGINGHLYDLIKEANVHNMQLIAGKGGPDDDTKDEYVVYIMDSSKYHFFQAESYHQFHANTVLGRPVPDTYLNTLKKIQQNQNRLQSPGCE